MVTSGWRTSRTSPDIFDFVRRSMPAKGRTDTDNTLRGVRSVLLRQTQTKTNHEDHKMYDYTAVTVYEKDAWRTNRINRFYGYLVAKLSNYELARILELHDRKGQLYVTLYVDTIADRSTAYRQTYSMEQLMAEKWENWDFSGGCFVRFAYPVFEKTTQMKGIELSDYREHMLTRKTP